MKETLIAFSFIPHPSSLIPSEMPLTSATLCNAVVNTETVTYFQRLTQSTFDAGTVVPFAKRLQQSKDETGGTLQKQELTWNLWTVHLSGIVPKVNDQFVDGDGFTWIVHKVDMQRLGQRFRLATNRQR